MAADLGVDRVFTRGTTPGEVASYLVHRLAPVPEKPSSKASSMPTTNGQDVGARVVHRRYVPYSHAHYAGNLVDGAYSLGLFGDVATEMCILTDGDEGLFASYSDVQFREPVRAGDVLEIVCELVGWAPAAGCSSSSVSVVARGNPTDEQPGAARAARPAAASRPRRPAPSSCPADVRRVNDAFTRPACRRRTRRSDPANSAMNFASDAHRF